ncbi:MAG: site-specific integrase, partial [Proteobacteria bacterium]
IQMNTVRENVSMLRTYTKDWLALPCPEISPGHVKKVLIAMDHDGYSRSRLKSIRGAINTVFKWAIEDGVLKGLNYSPAKGVDLGKAKDEKPPMILNLAEIRKLLDSAKEMDHLWYPIWAMALNSGMRSGELYALEWKDIDWDNGLITVSKSYNNRMNVTKSTKAGYWRKVPINKELRGLLNELKLKADPTDLNVLPRINIWRRGEAAKVLREFCDGIGIPSVSFHTLRACFATHLLNAGVTSPIVKKICGWTDEKVMTRYIRLAGIDVSGATEVLDFDVPTRSGQAQKRVVNLDVFRSN